MNFAPLIKNKTDYPARLIFLYPSLFKITKGRNARRCAFDKWLFLFPEVNVKKSGNKVNKYNQAEASVFNYFPCIIL